MYLREEDSRESERKSDRRSEGEFRGYSTGFQPRGWDPYWSPLRFIMGSKEIADIIYKYYFTSVMCMQTDFLMIHGHKQITEHVVEQSRTITYSYYRENHLCGIRCTKGRVANIFRGRNGVTGHKRMETTGAETEE